MAEHGTVLVANALIFREGVALASQGKRTQPKRVHYAKGAKLISLAEDNVDCLTNSDLTCGIRLSWTLSIDYRNSHMLKV